ncbi:helix-turn-helix domain-containing protein [Enhydrobacter sp.]|uniref:helix-turn-helix domain-containing protein n=1 Tax=Enhydrobacter sp. TaxID=1894999 RepID=UPI00344F6EDC
MGRHYSHLTLEERCTIAQLRQAGQSVGQIAAALDRPIDEAERDRLRRLHRWEVLGPNHCEGSAAAHRRPSSCRRGAQESPPSLSYSLRTGHGARERRRSCAT